MKTTFAARHFEPGSNLQDYSMDAVGKLEQFFDRIISCDVVLEPNPDPETPCTAEINVKIPRKLIHATEKGQTYEHAINSAIDTASRQIRRYKTRHFEHH